MYPDFPCNGYVPGKHFFACLTFFRTYLLAGQGSVESGYPIFRTKDLYALVVRMVMDVKGVEKYMKSSVST